MGEGSGEGLLVVAVRRRIEKEIKGRVKISPAMSLRGINGRRKKKLRWPDGEGPPISEE
jgi:hypothetical protein